jgi:hypothetical protein
LEKEVDLRVLVKDIKLVSAYKDYDREDRSNLGLLLEIRVKNEVDLEVLNEAI